MNHHMRSNPMANMAHHQQQLLQQRTAQAAAALLNHHQQQQQLLNHHGHLAHHQQAPQRAISNSPHHHQNLQQQQQQQHHQHSHRPPGRPPANNTSNNHHSVQQQQQQHHHHHQAQQQQQQHHHSRNGPHHPPNMAQTQRSTGTHHPPAHPQHHSQQQQQQHGGGGHHHHSSSTGQHHTGQPRSQSQQHHAHHGHAQEKPQSAAATGAAHQQPQQQSQQQQPQQAPQPPPLPPPLPKGWKREEVARKRGATSGLVDVVYYEASAPEKKFRSKLQLQRHFGDKHDVSVLDYRTGKLLQHVYKKHRRMKGIAANPGNYTLAAKYDVYLNVPTRQTASIFKQPVNYVTNNIKYGNDATPSFVTDFAANSAQAMAANQITQNQLAVLSRKPAAGSAGDRARPNQLFWELRFNGLRAVDAAESAAESAYKPIDFDLVNLSKFKNLNISNETALRSVAVSWYLNPNKLLLGQDKEFLRNPRVFIDRDQPLIPALTIKEDDIKHQEKKIKEIRDKIRQAMSDLEAMEGDDEGIGADEMENGEEEKETTSDQANVSEVKQEATEEATATTEATATDAVIDGDVEMTKAEPKEQEDDVAAESTKEEPNGNGKIAE